MSHCWERRWPLPTMARKLPYLWVSFSPFTRPSSGLRQPFSANLPATATTISYQRLGRELFWSLAGNAIVIALAAAAIWRLTGLGLHPVADRMLSMLSDASIPTALFALGLSLATYSLRGQWSGMAVLIAMKMVLMPILVFLALYYIISVPPLWAKIALLLAAMPTGANAFLFAHRNEESVPAVSGAVAVGTALAAITVSLLLYLMDSGAA